MITRRTALQAGLLGAAASATTAIAATSSAAVAVPPDLSFLRDAPLMNADRARFFMEREGIDALIVAQPVNVFYVTNHWPQLARMGYSNTMFGVFSRDPGRPIALIAHGFGYYYSHSDEAAFDNRIVFTFTSPAGSSESPASADDPAAEPPYQMRIMDEELVTPRERRRRAMLAGIKSNSSSSAGALVGALRELRLEKATLGIDDPILEAMLRPHGIDTRFVPADETLRRIRFAKSPTEVRLIRLAAQQNVDAALAAAKTARDAGSTRVLRSRFLSEAALRGNLGLFMVIDGSSSEVMDWPLRDGTAISIDCVSTCRFYHGDYARTIFIGEPPAPIRRAVSAISTAWDDVRSQLRAGLRYSDIRRLGRESLKKQGVDLTVSFNPHSVGLFHSDHPGTSMAQGRVTTDHVLEENTVLSVDCPVLDTGLGGTGHLEDLMLIRSDGAEPLHGTGNRVIVV